MNLASGYLAAGLKTTNFHLTFGWIYILLAVIVFMLGQFYFKIPWWGTLIIVLVGVLMPVAFPQVYTELHNLLH